MENNPKKSKAFIIAFILVLLLLLGGYYLFSNKDKIFGTKGSMSLSKIFTPLIESITGKSLKTIDTNNGGVAKIDCTLGVIDKDNKVVCVIAGEDLKKGDVVYISGFDKNKIPIVMKAIANDKKKSLVFGVASEDAAKGSTVNIIVSGNINGISTDRKEGTPWAMNNPLYLSDTVAGAMTKNPPTSSSSFIIPIGSINKIDATNGSIRIGDLMNDPNISKTSLQYLSIINSQLLKDSINGGYANSTNGLSANSFSNYWSSIFSNNSYSGVNSDGINFSGNGGISSSGTSTQNGGYFNSSGQYVPALNPITIPGSNTTNNGGIGSIGGGTGSIGGGGGVVIGGGGTSSTLPQVAISASLRSVPSGGSSTISWTSINTTSCNAGAGNGTGTTGSFDTGALTVATSYTVTCTGANGEASNNINITISGTNNNGGGGGTATLPKVTITPSFTSIASGSSVTISWTSVNTTSCDAGTGNGTGVSGSFDTGSLTSSTSYTVTCIGPDGSNSATSNINISTGGGGGFGNMPMVSVIASPFTVPSGGSSTISWTSTNTKSCDAGTGNGTGVSGSFDTGALTAGTSYTITCKGPNGQNSATAYVNLNIGNIVIPVSTYPTVSVTASPSTVNSGETSTISWTSTNANTCNAGAGNGTGTTGSFTTKPITKNTSYTVTCTGDSGEGSGNAFVILFDANNNSSSNPVIDTSGNQPQCSNGIDDDGDGLIDEADPNCHMDGDLTKEYVPTNNSEVDSPTTPFINKCVAIDFNPLTDYLTDANKAKLAELTRKFYLIAPTLKTENDITVAYNELAQYNNLSDHLDTLINECYDQGIDRTGVVNPSYKGPTIRFGNPWYKYKQRGSYITGVAIPTSATAPTCPNGAVNPPGCTLPTTTPPPFDCKYVAGWFSGMGADGNDCEIYNYNTNKTGLYDVTPPSCKRPFATFPFFSHNYIIGATSAQQSAYQAGLKDKCKWNTGAFILDMEEILNVW